MRAHVAIAFLCAATGSHAQLGPEHRFVYPAGGDALAIHDVDGDGDGDLLREVGGRLLLHEQTGPQMFAVSGDLGNAGTVHCIRLGDVDGDGLDDVVFTDVLGDRIGCAHGLGSGAFAQTITLITGLNDPWRVETGDLDGDGDLDLVYAAGSGWLITVAWSENMGGGVFAPGISLSSGSIDPGGIAAFLSRFALGDVDEDGDIDVVLCNPDLSWLENVGTGIFTEHAIAGDGLDLALVDLDGDDDLDLLLLAYTQLVRILNDGTGTFGPAEQAMPLSSQGSSTYDLVMGDRDGDGDLDAFFQTAGDLALPNLIISAKNDGTGIFSMFTGAYGFPSDNLKHYAVGQLDGDAMADALSHQNDGVVAVFSSAGVVRLTSIAPLSITPVDVNTDGAMDVMVSAYAPYSGFEEGPAQWGMAVHLNAGSGVMLQEPQAPMPTPNSTRRTAAADVDNDGDKDVVALWWDPMSGNNLQWYLLRNNAGALDSVQVLGLELLDFYYHTTPVFVDIDLDGDLDFTWFDLGCGEEVELNDGTGSFADPVQYALFDGPGTPQGSSLIDMDGDNDPDFVYGVSSSPNGPDSLFWEVNDGTGVPGAQAFAGLAPFAIYPMSIYQNPPPLQGVDLDLDGWKDLVAFNNNNIALLRNTGNGAFELEAAVAATNMTGMAVGDMNFDGLPDIIALCANRNIFFWPNLGDCALGDASLVANWQTQTGSTDLALADMDGDGDLDVLTCSSNGSAAWLGNNGDLPTTSESSASRSHFMAYPNPMTRSSRLVSPEPLGPQARIALLDLNGRVLRTRSGNGTCEVNIERDGLMSGLYLLRIQDGQGPSAVVRLVVE